MKQLRQCYSNKWGLCKGLSAASGILVKKGSWESLNPVEMLGVEGVEKGGVGLDGLLELFRWGEDAARNYRGGRGLVHAHHRRGALWLFG